jgi:DNA-binding MltR family transcriptional regulator
LVAAALLDLELEKLLRARFVHTSGTAQIIDGLFKDPGALLGSTVAKEKLAYAMGLIDGDLFSDLAKVRRLRNRVAHSSGTVTLDLQDLKPFLETLSPQEEKFCRASHLASIEALPEHSRDNPLVEAKLPTLPRLYWVLAALKVVSKLERLLGGAAGG